MVVVSGALPPLFAGSLLWRFSAVTVLSTLLRRCESLMIHVLRLQAIRTRKTVVREQFNGTIEVHKQGQVYASAKHLG